MSDKISVISSKDMNLMSAIQSGNYEKVAQLIFEGADPNAKIYIQDILHSPLYLSTIVWENDSISKLLIEKGANVDFIYENTTKRVPLLNGVIEKKNFKIVKLMLEHGANVNCLMTTRDGIVISALSCSVSVEADEITKLLIDFGAYVNSVAKIDGTELPVLNVAVTKSNESIVRYLLQHRANPNSERYLADGSRFSALRDSIYRWPNQAIFEMLINAGADPNYIDMNKENNTQTPILIYAIMMRNPKQVNMLLQKGANPDCERIVSNGRHISAIQMCRQEYSNVDIEKMLMAELNKKDEENDFRFRNNQKRSIVQRIVLESGIYEGDVSSQGRRTGNGKMSYKDGSEYIGQWNDNLKNGHGIMKYANGDVYEGEWKNDKRVGYGVLKNSWGDIREGEWKDDEIGYGILRQSNGDVLEGDVGYGVMDHGHYIYRYANGDIYDGEFEMGSYHGHGKMQYANGDVYDGEWKEGWKDGHGIMKYANGDVFDGEWENDSWLHGIMKYVNGDVYEGDYYDKPHGYGIMKYANGNVYEGYWKWGSRNGNGVMKYSNGDIYDGEWNNDQKNGHGIMKLANGEAYEGEWKDNENVSQLSHRALAVSHSTPDSKAANPISGLNTGASDKILDELNSLIGLDKVKEEVNNLINFAAYQKKREKAGFKKQQISNHMVFLGNPGTGKTTVARILAKIFKEIGLLSKGQLVEVDRSQLVANYVGQTADKTKGQIERALGGILFIDEAYTLYKKDSTNDFGQEAIDTLLKMMEDHRNDLIVVVAGYTREMTQFLDSNPGLKSRFPKLIRFEDYTAEELGEIFSSMVKNNDLKLTEEARQMALEYFCKVYQTRTETFGNAREVRNFFERVQNEQANRVMRDNSANLVDILPEDIEAAAGIQRKDEKITLEGEVKKLNEMVGLESVKKEIKTLINQIKVQRFKEQNGLRTTYSQSYHMVFTGNPGTGKTTVARIIANIFKELGILSTGQLIEVDRAKLVAGYTGQTALKTKESIQQALGGILFIDEAYALIYNEQDMFGKEAIDTLLKYMEDNRQNLVVIAAGYSKEMNSFLDSNPGLRSRFPKVIQFDDYNSDQLLEIFKKLIGDNGYEIDEKGLTKAKEIFCSIYENRDKNFANGRTVRNYFERVIERQNNRIGEQSLSMETINKILAEDL